jgi:tRNA-specific 2-thiouridylase
MPERVLVAMSGGVDSSVAAALLVEQGHHVEGATLKMWDPARGCPDPARSARLNACCSIRDVADAAQVCARLGIPFHVVDATADFQRAVVAPALAEYAAGRTPNPCVECNRALKFGTLLAWARDRGFEALATGHYARVLPGPGGLLRLARAKDRHKDQSYFLYFLAHPDLRRARFPLGGLDKPEVRRRAAALGLVTADKPESQDLCVPLTRPEVPGQVVDLQGRVLGHHRGVAHFTVGQRRGLRVASAAPLYVVRLEPEANRVVLGTHADLLAGGLDCERLAWNGEVPAGPIPALVQIRHRHAAVPARVTVSGGAARVRFEQPVAAVAPGQVAVIYDGEVVLGGGVIARAWPAPAAAAGPGTGPG